MRRYNDLAPSLRTIMTPGPVEVDPRVLRAMSYPILGQFDPEFTDIMNETMEMLRLLFRTGNRWAYPVDGTSRSGLEAVLCSVIEPGDKVLVPVFGRFGYLLQEIAERCGAQVTVLEKEWGTVFDPGEIIAAIRRERPAVVALVHGETSTGRLQPLDGIGQACRETDTLLVVDAVATIGGVPVETDAWLLDAVVGGTQKCLSVPSGMSPVTYNERVEQKVMRRKKTERGIAPPGEQLREGLIPVRSNYFDLGMLQDYWSPRRLNHHTEATSMLYALREGVRLVLEEGLEERYNRHRLHEKALMSGLAAMGLALYGDPACKLPVVACVLVPEGIEEEPVRGMLLKHFGIEIAGSFGPLKGRIWRIGTMGFSAREANVLHFLGAFEAVLLRYGASVLPGAGVREALKVYEEGQQTY
jgi:(S)-ureidoglycine---glyoxylate transaminase